MFLDLLSLMAGIAGCLGAVVSGKHPGTIELLIRWTLGLTIGFGCFFILRFGMKRILQRFRLYDPNLPPLRLMLSWLFSILAFVWIIVSGVIGFWVTKSLIRMF
jgi:hypothetical protein